MMKGPDSQNLDDPRLHLNEVTNLGRRVDPVIIRAVSRAPSREFLHPLTYHFKVGGKRMRAAMVILGCAASGGSFRDGLKPAAAVEMVHNYSLVMDDLIDHGIIRRGKPTVRAKFGDSTSLLIAMMYREVLDDLISESPREQQVRAILVRAMKEIIDGERLDMEFEQAGRDEPYLSTHRIRKASFQLYLRMIGKKTASLFQAAGEVGGHSAGAKPRVVRALGGFGWKAGLAFQIMDDVLDICGEETGKQAAKDVIEHKLGNAAVLTALRHLHRRDRTELMAILASREVSLTKARSARRLIMKTPAELECREIAAKYLQDAKVQLSFLRPSKYRAALFSLGERIVIRTF